MPEMRLALIASLGLSLSACIIYAPSQPAPSATAAPVAPAAPSRPEPSPPPTIAGAIQACKNIQQDARIPVACGLEYVDNVPVIFVGFPDVATFTQLWEPMTEAVGGPFCIAANNVSREAYVSVVVDELVRVFSCETSEWTDWRPVSSEDDHEL